MRLDDYLRDHKLTQAQFGEKLTPPVSQAHVSQWVRGVTRVTLEQALQIDQVTGGAVSPADCAAMFGAVRESTKEQAAA